MRTRNRENDSKYENSQAVSTQSQHVLVVFGTRPEAVKVAPVVEAMRARGVRAYVVSTGQHVSLLDPQVMAHMEEVEELKIESDGSVLKFLNTALAKLREVIERVKPALVLVQGDTMSAMAGALAASRAGVPIAHVEAGVRSGNRREPWPEENIRVEIDALAALHYAPTEHAAKALAAEGHKRIWITGNTCVDAMRLYGGNPTPRDMVGAGILVTLHRRELRAREDVRDIIHALCASADLFPNVTFTWPVHPGMLPLVDGLRPPPNLHLRPPFNYEPMLIVLGGSSGVLTDSGGLVEEAATLGVPTAILRAANDRPEAVIAGIARQFEPTVGGVAEAVATLVQGTIPRKPTQVYGDGHASERIAQHIVACLSQLTEVA